MSSLDTSNPFSFSDLPNSDDGLDPNVVENVAAGSSSFHKLGF